MQINYYVSFILDTFIIVSAVWTYSYLFYKVLNILSSNVTSNGNETQKRSRHPSLKFLIPLLMIATYLAFNVSGTFIQNAAGYNFNQMSRKDLVMFHIGWLMIGIGYLTDAALYVFLQKDVRSFIMSSRLCKKGPKHRSSAVHPFQRNNVFANITLSSTMNDNS